MEMSMKILERIRTELEAAKEREPGQWRLDDSSESLWYDSHEWISKEERVRRGINVSVGYTVWNGRGQGIHTTSNQKGDLSVLSLIAQSPNYIGALLPIAEAAAKGIARSDYGTCGFHDYVMPVECTCNEMDIALRGLEKVPSSYERPTE